MSILSKAVFFGSVTAVIIHYAPQHASAVTPKAAVSYNKFEQISLKKCFKKKFFSETVKKCIKPGKVGGGVNGLASVLTFANDETGEIGAVLLAEQNFIVELFGKKVTIGAVCSYNNTKSSSFSFFAGYSLSPPAIPSVSVVDILSAAVSARLKAASGAMKGVSPTATRTNGRFNSGYVGALPSSKFKSLMSAAAVGCTLKYPDYKLFSGIKSIELFKAGVEFSTAATNWKVNTDNGSAAVLLQTKITAIAKVGGKKIKFKVLGKRVSWKLPGYSVKKGKTLTNDKISF